jgi:hypothetical protein
MIKFLIASLLASFPTLALAQTSTSPAPDSKVDVIFTGGHETVGADRGRPVILIAAALKVPDQVFRDAFKGVRPAQTGSGPTDAEARANKQVLMAALGPYGVTDDRLNEVSNYYRYRRSAGEMWRNTPAKAFATVHNGVVMSITITDAGSGYSSAPTVTLAGMTDVHLTATLAFGTDFAKNGLIKDIKISP